MVNIFIWLFPWQKESVKRIVCVLADTYQAHLKFSDTTEILVHVLYYRVKKFEVIELSVFVCIDIVMAEYIFDLYYKTFIILKQYMENDKHWNKRVI